MATLARSTPFVPTVQIPLVDGKYHCPECGEPYEQRRGLGSHRTRAHNVKGTSPSVLSANRTKAAKAKGKGKTLPFAQVKKLQSKPAKVSKAKPGVSVCDLWIGEGKARHFCGYQALTPAHMGRHKWFTHGIKGTAHLSKRDKALLTPTHGPKRGRPFGTGKHQTLAEAVAAVGAGAADVGHHSGMLFPCVVPGCTHRPFKTQGRLTNHINKFHQDDGTDLVHIPNPTHPKGHKHGSSNGNNGNHNGIPQDLDAVSRTILPEVYADTVGQIKGWLFALAAQNDIPPQHFASRVIRDLYGTTRRT